MINEFFERAKEVAIARFTFNQIQYENISQIPTTSSDIHWSTLFPAFFKLLSELNRDASKVTNLIAKLSINECQYYKGLLIELDSILELPCGQSSIENCPRHVNDLAVANDVDTFVRALNYQQLIELKLIGICLNIKGRYEVVRLIETAEKESFFTGKSALLKSFRKNGKNHKALESETKKWPDEYRQLLVESIYYEEIYELLIDAFVKGVDNRYYTFFNSLILTPNRDSSSTIQYSPLKLMEKISKELNRANVLVKMLSSQFLDFKSPELELLRTVAGNLQKDFDSLSKITVKSSLMHSIIYYRFISHHLKLEQLLADLKSFNSRMAINLNEQIVQPSNTDSNAAQKKSADKRASKKQKQHQRETVDYAKCKENNTNANLITESESQTADVDARADNVSKPSNYERHTPVPSNNIPRNNAENTSDNGTTSSKRAKTEPDTTEGDAESHEHMMSQLELTWSKDRQMKRARISNSDDNSQLKESSNDKSAKHENNTLLMLADKLAKEKEEFKAFFEGDSLKKRFKREKVERWIKLAGGEFIQQEGSRVRLKFSKQVISDLFVAEVDVEPETVSKTLHSPHGKRSLAEKYLSVPSIRSYQELLRRASVTPQRLWPQDYGPSSVSGVDGAADDFTSVAAPISAINTPDFQTSSARAKR